MDKKSRDIAILITILIIGLNVVMYSYYVKPGIDKLKNNKIEYKKRDEVYKGLLAFKDDLANKELEIERYKSESEEFNKLVPGSIDTPQLIYDFYTACINFGLIGKNATFQLSGKELEGGSDQFKVLQLNIGLNFEGNRVNTYNLLNNIDKITARKLNLESLALKQLAPDNLDVNIMFSQFVKVLPKDMEKIKEYSFFDRQVGYPNFMDMFK